MPADSHNLNLNRATPVLREIERKFLVGRLPLGFAGRRGKSIAQGYLAVTRDGSEVRVRDCGGKLFLTIKHGAGVVRDELELALTEERFKSLWKLTRGRRISKIRYLLPHGPNTLELDVYSGPLRGLKTVEVEFPTLRACRAFKPPDWFGREITQEPAYKNRNLALGLRIGLAAPQSDERPAGFSPFARTLASIGTGPQRATNDTSTSPARANGNGMSARAPRSGTEEYPFHASVAALRKSDAATRLFSLPVPRSGRGRDSRRQAGQRAG
jgi:CYTH domain-containing protein